MIMRFVVVFFCSCISFLGACSYQLRDNEYDFPNKSISQSLDYFEDRNNIIQPQSLSTVEWNDIKEYQQNSFNKNSTYWFRLNIHNVSARGKYWLLELLDPNLNEVRFVCPDQNINWEKSGNLQNFSTREIDHKNFVMPFELAQSDSVTVYLAIKNSFKSGVSLAVRPTNEFMGYALSEYYFLGIFYGIIFILAVYNLILFFYTREPSYFYYTVYVLCFMLNTFRIDGLGFQFFWPEFPVFSQFLEFSSPLLLVLSFALYARAFLTLNSFSDNYRNILIGVLAGFVGLYTFNVLFIDKPYHDFLLVGAFLVIGIGGFMARKNGDKSAGYFLVAYSFLIVGFLIYALRNLHLIPTSVFTIYALNLSFIIEVLIFSIGIGRKFKFAKEEQERIDKALILQLQENEKLKDALNEELQAKVIETTNDLEQKNLMMQQMLLKIRRKNRQIQDLNGILNEDDKDGADDMLANLDDDDFLSDFEVK